MTDIEGATPFPLFVVDEIPAQVVSDYLVALQHRSQETTFHGEQDYTVHLMDKYLDSSIKPTTGPVDQIPQDHLGKAVADLRQYVEQNIYSSELPLAKSVFIVMDKQSSDDGTVLVVSNSVLDPTEARAEFAVSTEVLVAVEWGVHELNEGMSDSFKKDGQYHYTVDAVDSQRGK